ncbi:MAG: hypothetical protein HWE24_08795 [Oceanospirillaceae bacterium]|nr:hypothetical protein [Oceanospirillaceae bacterium]
MKTKSFIQPSQQYTNDKKPTDYWGMLFVSFIFLSSISCFLFANHSERSPNSLPLTSHQISATAIDLDHNSKR